MKYIPLIGVCVLSICFVGVIITYSGMVDRAQDQTSRALKVAKDWQEIAEGWKNASDRFEKVANECLAYRRQ